MKVAARVAEGREAMRAVGVPGTTRVRGRPVTPRKERRWRIGEVPASMSARYWA
jgi:hypothetical protein